MKRWRQLGSLFLLPIVSGLLLVLSFPRFDFGFLAWIALIPLLFAIENRSARVAFGQGFIAGLIFFSGTLYWVSIAIHVYGKAPLLLSFLAMFLLSIYCACYVGLFAWAFRLISGEADSCIFLTAPASWVSLELARNYLFSGFPWSLLGYSQYRYLPVIQIADISGVYGVSFLVVLVNVSLASLVLRSLLPNTSTHSDIKLLWKGGILSAVIVGVAIGYGYWRIQTDSRTSNHQTVRIGLVQANIDQSQKWDIAFRRETIDRYKRLTLQTAKDTDLIVWPEAATPFLFEAETNYRQELLRFVRAHGVPLLFGSPATAMENNPGPLHLTNSAFLVSSDGVVLDRYNKIHLVPFGEYVPFKSLFAFLDKLVVGIGDFVPGRAPRLMKGPGGQFGVVICFEVIFPDLVRRFVALGANYMVTITNDAWFGPSSAPYQHFSMVVFRAVENRVSFARAANTGISGFIDPYGRILHRTDIFTEDALTGPIRTETSHSLYTAFGDLFAYGCLLVVLVTSTKRLKLYYLDSKSRSEFPALARG